MSDQELFDKIVELVNREKEPISKKTISNNSFIEITQDKSLLDLWQKSRFVDDWEWHQVVRFVLNRENAPQFMYEKLWSLLNEHRGSYDDYFELETELGTFPEPNPLSNLNKLESLYSDFFELFQDITNHIHFDNPRKDFYGASFRGKINWDKTLRRSATDTPLQFHSSIPIKKFETPENILLVLCAKWLHHECNRILQLNFNEELSTEKKKILEIISTRTKNMILHFPFQNVIKSSMRLWNFDYNNNVILNLEKNIQKRITDGTIRNKSYSKLLFWLDKFRDLNLMMVSENTPVTNLLKSKDSQDTVYEAWIFLEIYDYFLKSGLTPVLHFDSKENYFDFNYNGHEVKFYYDREYLLSEDNVWALQHKPDYSVMVDGKVVAVFDAKNFSKGQVPSPAINKILSYMHNFNTKIGMLFFPFLPETWDEWGRKKKLDILLPLYAEKYPEKNEVQLRSLQKPESGKDWDQIDVATQEKIPLKSFRWIENPQDSQMLLYLVRFQPDDSELGKSMKKQSLNIIFNEIKKYLDGLDSGKAVFP